MYEFIEVENGQRILKESFGRPTVYLDHWALNDLSLNKQYRDRFIKAMNERHGTLRLSAYNIEELINQTDKSQISSILRMIDSVDCGFININFLDVIKKENQLIANSSIRYDPSAELDFIHDYLMSKNWPLKWHISDIISTVIKEASVKVQRERSLLFTNKMNSLINSARNSQEYLKKAANHFCKTKGKGQEYPAATRELFVMAHDFIIKNRGMKMPNSAWSDLFHLIVPVAYCDIVLTDKRWKTFIDQTGLKYPGIAMVFCRPSVENFFDQLENATYKE